MPQSIPERTKAQNEQWRKAQDQGAFDLRVAVPGIIQSFDASKQTVVVQAAIRERINLNGVISWETMPLLVDVPIFMPRAGGYALTLPVQAGDECLVVFGDACIDAWWQSGGVQNQIDRRRHDLSDGFAIVGIWSQPKVISDYSTNSAQLRNEAGSAYVEIKGDVINLVSPSSINGTAPNITMTASTQFEIITPLLNLLVDAIATAASGGSGNVGNVAINGNSITINGNNTTSIDGKAFLTHKHTGVQGGSSDTGAVA